jgi:alcohol dehydrogenase
MVVHPKRMTMKAAVLKAFGSPLTVETVPDPVLGTGEVIVDVAATKVLAYADDVLSGKRNYPLDLPSIPGPGGIGRVRSVGPDSTHLAVGDWVFCDPTVRSRDDAVAPDILLQGLVAAGDGGQRLQQYFRDGSWAERQRLPTENAIRIGAIDAADAPRWCALGMLLVPYGGLRAVGLQAGETVLINGATGAFGSAGIAVALAMGAASVIATGRNGKVLEDLGRRFGPRLRTVPMLGKEEDDRRRILQAASGPIDVVLDLLPPAAAVSQVRAALLAVRPYGRVVLMGGVGMHGSDDLGLPYAWLMRNCITVRGQWMYRPDAVTRVAGMVRAGLVRLDEFAVTSFDLDQVNEAVAHAAANAGPFQMTVLRPS